jgi:hypothetical protein
MGTLHDAFVLLIDLRLIEVECVGHILDNVKELFRVEIAVLILIE